MLLYVKYDERPDDHRVYQHDELTDDWYSDTVICTY